MLLRQSENSERRKRDKLPCSLKIEIRTPRGLITAPVYEISNEGILISGPDARRLSLHETLGATLQNVGACQIRIGERTNAGTLAQFARPDAALNESIEDALWSIHDENTEFVTCAHMEAGTALMKIFENGVASGAIPIEDMFDTDYVEISGTNPVQHRTSNSRLGSIVRCRRSRKRFWPRIRAWRSRR